MTRKRYIPLILGIAALVFGVQSAVAAMPVEPTARHDPDRAFVRAAKFYKESQRITPTPGSPRPADFWNYDSGVKVADASPGVLPQDLATLYGISGDTSGDGPQLFDLMMAKNGVVDRSV